MRNKVEWNANLIGHEYIMEEGKTRVRIVVFADAERLGRASVLEATGTQAKIANCLKWFTTVHEGVKIITNQVHREQELRAMYAAGFRYFPPTEHKVPRLKETLWQFRQVKSIMLTWTRDGKRPSEVA